LNSAAGPEVVSGDFSAVPLAAACADWVWSQEALLHAPDRRQVLAECARLLRPGGQLLFTDVLQTGPMEPEEARLIFERVKVNSLETWEGYHAHLASVGLRLVEALDLSRYLASSYANLVGAMRRNYDPLVAEVGAAAVDYTLAAFERWVRAGEDGKLGWAMFMAWRP
jgi:ubiquinone/menaquinone biosynthesis C-methylase UbiE